MTFEAYQKEKSSSWFSRVKGTGKGKAKAEKTTEVVINIGILGWNVKHGQLKPVRGRRIILKISHSASYNQLKEKAVRKFIDFHKNIVNDDEDYEIAFEHGEIAKKIPGTTEPFRLNRYKEELGREYKNIVLYLVHASDIKAMKKVNINLEEDYFSDDDDDFVELLDSPFVKRRKLDNSESLPPQTDSPGNGESSNAAQINEDEKIATELQVKFDNELQQSQFENEDQQSSETTPQVILSVPATSVSPAPFLSLSEISSYLKNQVPLGKESLYLVVRRGATLERRLNLWKRETKSGGVLKPLMVKYMGEDGIDQGAIAKEFVSDLIRDIKLEVFEGGAPRDSMSDFQNGTFRACGEIGMVSLVIGGPPPCFLHKNVFQLMLEENIDLANLPECYFLPGELEKFEQIRLNPTLFSDFIIDNGYTGTISEDHVDSILNTIMISITRRRQTYLEGFLTGVDAFNLKKLLRTNDELLEKVFVSSSALSVDAKYLFSILEPSFSIEGSSQRKIENDVMDNFQDFLHLIEDECITGLGEVFTNDEDIDLPPEKLQLTPAGVHRWFTGTDQKPLVEVGQKISIEFNHDCLKNNPDHKVCFPFVHACSTIVKLPVLHMKTFEDFKVNFTTAYCKAQAFGAP